MIQTNQEEVEYGELRRTDLVRERVLVIQEVLYPCHQVVNVHWGWEFGRFLIRCSVLPEVFVSVRTQCSVKSKLAYSNISGSLSSYLPWTG